MKNRTPFGQRVREDRLLLGLTQEELSRRVGCAAITVRKIEAGDLRPSGQIAQLLAKALDVPFEDQAEFVRQARSVKPGGAEPSPTPTPQVTREEIGQRDLSGRAIRGYTLGERLGQGGFGVVYRAVQPMVDREVAVKIILPEFADQPDFIRRFEAEAKTVARLEHPHIVPLYDYWREPAVAYLVMRLIRGGSLDDRLEDGAFQLGTVADIVYQVAGALRAAHRVGVVHRDLKPANILLDEDGNAYLTDFGIAKSQSNLEFETQTGFFLGSPAYSSPEQIRGEPILPQADIYSMGVLIFELLSGERPFEGPTPIDLIQQHLNTPMPSITDRRKDLPPALDAVISRSTAKDPGDRYPDIRDLASDLREIAESGHLSAAGDTRERPFEIVNPYKGLRAFGEADAADFQGRETLVQQLLARMAENSDLSRFLAIIGPSGSGKSSVAKAGLMPALRRGALPGSENWFIIDFTPGNSPMEKLAEALDRIAVGSTDDVLQKLLKDPYGLVQVLEQILPDDDTTQLVILIDQFEEIFTHDLSEEARAHLLEMLVTTVLDARSRASIVLTLRADFIDRPLRYTDFAELLKSRSELVLPLTPDELEHAIRNPAERVGLTVEPELVAAVIGDVTDQPGALPLMQYALTETFEHRPNGQMTLETYRDLGGVRGALAQRADVVYAGLGNDEEASARQMFLRLVTLGEGVENTRRRVPRSELMALSSDLDTVVDRFAAYRLLTLDRDPATREPTVEVAHEALLQEWPMLRQWVQESRDDIRMQRQLSRAAREWEAADQDQSFLLRGARLEQFESWMAETELALTDLERAYFEAGLSQRAEESALESGRKEREARMEKTRRTLSQVLAGVMAVGIVAALGLSAFALNQRDQAQNSFLQAERIRLASQAQIALDTGEDAIVPALLALRSLKLGYSPEADAALITALGRGFPLQRYVGHTDAVSSIEISPDQRFVLTASNDETARLWSLETGEELVRFVGHADLIKVAVFSPDGRRVLTGSADGTVRIWDVDTGNEMRRFPDHDGAVWALAISPDGKQVLTSDDSGIAYLWDANTLEQRFQLSGHADTVVWGGFSSDNNFAFTGSVDRTARLWDVHSGAEIRQFEGHDGSIVGGAISPDGKYLVTASGDNTARLWDVAGGQELQRFVGHTNFLYSAVFSPDSQFVLTGSLDRSVRLWAPDTGEQLRQFIGHTGGVGPVAFAPDGQSFLTGSTDQIGRMWALQFDREPRVLSLPFRSVHSSEVILAKFTTNGEQIVTGAANGAVRLWDAKTGQILEEGNFDIAGLLTDLVFSPDGKVALTATNQGISRIWDVATGTSMGELRDEGSLTWDLDFSPDGSMVLTADNDGIVRMWDFRSREIARQLIGHEAPVRAVTFSPDGLQLVTGSEDGSARLWDAESGSELFVLDGHTGPIRSVAFSEDSRYVLTGSDDHSARLWDARTGREERNFTGHNGSVNAVAFSPDGRWVATGSGDLGARLWDRETGEVVRHLVGNTSPVQILEFSPDGTNLLTGTIDSLQLWKTELADVVAFACKQMPRDFTAEERLLYSITDDIPTCEEVER